MMAAKKKAPPKQGEPGFLGVLFDDLMEAINNVEAWVKDSVDAKMLLEAQPRLKEAKEAVGILLSGCDSGIRAAIARAEGHVIFLPDGRTLAIAQGEKERTMRPDGYVQVHTRIANRALAIAQGEAQEAVMKAIEFTRQVYVAPSAKPKWTELQALGFTSWSEIADENEKPGDVKVTVPK